MSAEDNRARAGGSIADAKEFRITPIRQKDIDSASFNCQAPSCAAPCKPPPSPPGPCVCRRA